MQKQYILPISLGIGTGLLLLCILVLLFKLLNGSNKSRPNSRRQRKTTSVTPTPSIIPQNIPGFMLPTWHNVRVQEPLRRNGELGEDTSSDELDVKELKPRTNNNLPVSTIMTSNQSSPELREVYKMEPVSPIKKKSRPGLSGSISLQDLNVYTPKMPSRQSQVNENLLPSLKFALYYSASTSDLNVTVISVQNLSYLTTLTESPNLCVWVQVEFSRYQQEFRTKVGSFASETVFNETCVVSDFPVEHFSGSKISFRVFDNSVVVAEAVYLVRGLPPSFPRNETVELYHPGIVQSSQLSKTGEILIRLKYNPVEEIVTLGIVECRRLKNQKKRNKLLDTYVKVNVLFCDESVQKFKSKLVQKSNDPKFDTTFTLAGFFSRTKMKHVLVKVTVFAKSMTKNGLGYIVLGTGRQNDITASGYQHWESIIDKPQLNIVQWHALKPVRPITP